MWFEIQNIEMDGQGFSCVVEAGGSGEKAMSVRVSVGVTNKEVYIRDITTSRVNAMNKTDLETGMEELKEIIKKTLEVAKETRLKLEKIRREVF